MNVDSFNALVAELIDGLPASVVINRLTIALRVVTHDGGPAAQDALRALCATYRRRDEGHPAEEIAPPPPPPRKR